MASNALKEGPQDGRNPQMTSLSAKGLRLSIAVKLSTLHKDVCSLEDPRLLERFDLLLAELLSPFSTDEQRSILQILEQCEEPG